MLRREARLRKEYLYRKALEDQERKLHDQKAMLRSALKENGPIPSELKHQAPDLVKKMVYDEAVSDPSTSIDDEYAKAGVRDPKILITTSREPSSRLQQFAKEMRLVIPNAQRINRGNHVVEEIVAACRSNDVTDLVVLHEHRGVPDGMIVSHFPFGPTAYFSLYNVVLRHDVRDEDQKPVSEAYPHLIFSNFSTKLGQRTRDILKYLFPVPKDDSRRVLSWVNSGDFISFRHHVYQKSVKDVDLTEVGPRFELKLYQIKLGTVDQDEADTEWALRPYMNTSRKRDVL